MVSGKGDVLMKKINIAIAFMLLISLVYSPVHADEVKEVYLTFDDGPSHNTPQVLDILDKYNVKATFFVTGENARYQSYIRTAYLKGHAIGAHSYTHKYSIYQSEETYFENLGNIEKIIKEQTGRTSKLIRFPGGSSNTISRHYSQGIMAKVAQVVEKKGYKYYDWNVSSNDATRRSVNPARIIESSKSRLPRVCVLMHDTATKTTTVQALPAIIEYYQTNGYTFKTLEHTDFVSHQRINN